MNDAIRGIYIYVLVFNRRLCICGRYIMLQSAFSLDRALRINIGGSEPFKEGFVGWWPFR